MDTIIEPNELAKIRRELAITQKQLAKMCNISQSLIAKIEKGEVDPAYSKMRAISNALLPYLIKKGKKVYEIMSRNVISVSLYTTVKEASEIMTKHGISQMPVIEDNKVVGSISEKAILQALMNKKNSKKVFSIYVKDIMESPFPMVDYDTPVEAIYSLLLYYPAVLVLKNGEIKGIITKADIIKP
jgi:predicted transcriptional regulator